jgi:virulence-associated protein VapD
VRVITGGRGTSPANLQNTDYADRMYAIAFDLRQELLEKEYPGANRNNAYAEVRRELEKRGFGWQQGSVYFGNETVNAVTTVTAVQEVAKELPWFAKVVRDIRMLRIEENNDLSVALGGIPVSPTTGTLFDANADAA